MLEIAFGAALADEQVHSEAQLLPRFVQLRALVIGANAGERVGVQVFPAQAGRMAVDHFAAARFDLRQLALHSQKNAGIIHQLGDAGDPIVRDHQAQIVRGEARARRFQMRRRHAGRQHDEKIDRQILARLEHVTDPIHPENVRVFVRIDDHRSGAMRHDRARELGDRHHRAFDVEMSVDQTRREIRALEVDDFFRVVIAETDDALVVHRDVGFMDLAAEDVDELRVFEKEIGRFLAARDAEFVLDLSHLSSVPPKSIVILSVAKDL